MTASLAEDESGQLRSRVVASLEAGDAAQALQLLAAGIGDDLTHPLVSDYVALAKRSADAAALDALVERGRLSWSKLEAPSALALGTALAERGLFARAFEVAAAGALGRDPESACVRGTWALRAGLPHEAVAAADVAIQQLLHDGLQVEDFIRLSLRRAPSEGLMRFERSAVAHTPSLHEPLALRWEALRRAGRTAEAHAMRTVCIQHFPERASVWSTAGNHALDENDPDAAERYFERCLQLEPNWAAGLVGKAIVLEIRKDWPAALELRARVVQVTGALQRDDPGSLQRVLRFAVGFARVSRWQEAGPLFRRCLALGAFEALPAERPVIIRVFAGELYAPAVIATLCPRGVAEREATAEPELAAAVTLALREASALGATYRRISANAELAAPDRMQQLGICAWLAGDAAQAYVLLDEAEVEREGDLTTQYLLACAAAALGAEQCASIEKFALSAARAVMERLAQGQAVAEAEHFYALVTLARMEPGSVQAKPEGPLSEWLGFYFDAREQAAATCPVLAAAPAGAGLGAQLQRIAAFRCAQQIAGRSALEIARASADAAAQLTAAS